MRKLLLVSIIGMLLLTVAGTTFGVAIDPVKIGDKPMSCPNPLNVKSRGVLPVAILGTEAFDVMQVDVDSILLAGAEPIRNSYEDVATPMLDGEECSCSTEGPDGILDLVLKFKRMEVVSGLGDVEDGEEVSVPLTGMLFDGIAIEGEDCVVIKSKGHPKKAGQGKAKGKGHVQQLEAIQAQMEHEEQKHMQRLERLEALLNEAAEEGDVERAETIMSIIERMTMHHDKKMLMLQERMDRILEMLDGD